MTTLTGPLVQTMRMRALLLDGQSPHRSVGDVVTWMGAMQAQDLASGMWSLGVRLPHLRATDVDAAIERREALRTWPMRGTVHWVPARDARWMLDLMSAKPLAGAAGRRAYLGITEQTVQTANAALEAALRGGRRLTRAQCLEAIADAGVETPGQVGYHLLWYASQVGLTCMGPQEGTEQTFVLLDEWVPDPVRMEREEALAEIAVRYVRSHGPVTVKDLARWTGLGVRECRTGVAAAGERLVPVETEAGPMVAAAEALAGALPASPDAGGALLIPPGFDEYMLGYGDRSLMMDPEHMDAVVPGGNGVFRATLVRDGRVVATWKRTVRTRTVIVEVAPLARIGASERRGFETEFARYGAFLGSDVEVRWGTLSP